MGEKAVDGKRSVLQMMAESVKAQKRFIEEKSSEIRVLATKVDILRGQDQRNAATLERLKHQELHDHIADLKNTMAALEFAKSKYK